MSLLNGVKAQFFFASNLAANESVYFFAPVSEDWRLELFYELLDKKQNKTKQYFYKQYLS